MKLSKKTVIILVATVVVIAIAVTGILITVNKKKPVTDAGEQEKLIDSLGEIVPFSNGEENDDHSVSTVETTNETGKTEENGADGKTDENKTGGTDAKQPGQNNGTTQQENGQQGNSQQESGKQEATYYNYTYEKMLQNGNALVEKYGIQKEVIGTTLFGRDIVCFKVGNDNASRKMLVVSGVNGSEHDNALVMMKQIETYLADTASTFHGRKYAEIFNVCQVYFVPMLNPDGIELSINGLASVPEQYRQSVEQIAKYSAENGLMKENDYSLWNANGQGIDVSINFGNSFIVSSTLSSQPASKNFPGEEFETNEAKAIRDLCHKVNFETATQYAGKGNLVDWSFGQNISAQVSRDLASGLSDNTGFTIISNGPNRDFCITVNLAQWFIYEFDRPGFTVMMGENTPYTKNDVQSMWNALSTAPLFLAAEGNGSTDYEIID